MVGSQEGSLFKETTIFNSAIILRILVSRQEREGAKCVINS